MSLLAIKAALSTAGGVLSKVPRDVWYALLAGLAFWILSSHYYNRGYDKRTAEYVALIKAEKAKSAKGAVLAEEAAKQVVGAIEAENERAVQAAEDSDDPLKAALDVFE